MNPSYDVYCSIAGWQQCEYLIITIFLVVRMGGKKYFEPLYHRLYKQVDGYI